MSFRPEPGSALKVNLMVGGHFEGEPQKRNAAKIKEFALIGAGGSTPIPGLDGSEPAGLTKIEKPGLYVIGYRSNHSSIELDADTFTGYLEEEGLEHVVAEREKRGDSGQSAKEVYSRCAKSIVMSGSGDAAGFDRALNYSLELIPVKNPYSLKAGDELTIRLLFNGKPMEGAKVVAMNKAEPEKSESATSGEDGMTTFKLAKPGVWMIKTVHMVPAAKDSGADWESFWASLTFEIR